MAYYDRLDDALLASLKASLPAEGVLTAVLNVNPGHGDNQGGGALAIRAKNMLRDLEAPAELASVITDDLEDAERSTGKTRIYYVFEGGSEVVGLNVDMPEHLSYGPPNLEPLEMALENNEKTAIALVDHERGRLFIVDMGRIYERRRLEDTMEGNRFREVDASGNPRDMRESHSNNDPAADGGHRVSSGEDYDLFTSQAANQEMLFFKAIVNYLEQLRNAGEFSRLLVAGPVKPLTHFKGELTTGLQNALAGEFSVEASAPAGAVLQAAGEAIEAAEREADVALVMEARERGVRGPADTLAAVQEGRVYHLLVAGDGSSLPVWQDTDETSSYVFATYPEQGQSPLSGAAVTEKTLHDVIPLLRERYGVKVNYLSGENEQLVNAEMDGLAGLTRY